MLKPYTIPDSRVSETPLPDWLSDEYVRETDALRCTNKADRAKMAKVLTRLAAHYGAVIEVNPSPLNEQHGLTVYIRLNSAYVMIGLDGNSMNHRGKAHQQYGGVFLGHWNIETKATAIYRPYFGTLIGGDVNPYTGCKATQATRGFGQFIVRLAIALGSVQDGTAFRLPEAA